MRWIGFLPELSLKNQGNQTQDLNLFLTQEAKVVGKCILSSIFKSWTGSEGQGLGFLLLFPVFHLKICPAMALLAEEK